MMVEHGSAIDDISQRSHSQSQFTPLDDDLYTDDYPPEGYNDEEYYEDDGGPGSQNIKVCVRLRPVLAQPPYNEREDMVAWAWEDNTIYPKQEYVRKGSGNHNHVHFVPYTFDNLFYPDHTNADIFNGVVKNIALQCMLGYHGSVFTYGQTSSGKTFTMNGSPTQPGVISQVIYYCFSCIQEQFADREFLFRVSYIEVYLSPTPLPLGLSLTLTHTPPPGPPSRPHP